MTTEKKTIVLDTRGLNWATEKNLVEAVLGRRPGVVEVEANPVAQSANVVYDPGRTSIAELRDWVEECGLHCAGQSVPSHICDPMLDEERPEQRLDPPEGTSPHEAMGHGGHGAMSMDDMVKDMRNRFVVAAIFSVPILLWSPIGRDVFGFEVSAPFGLRDDVWMLLLSLPVILYSSSIFFDGAIRALKARTLDMMVLVAVAVAVAIGAGWLYSLGVTLTGGGEVFYEAATVLAAFVLLGHWFEMRARGGANDAIRSLLDLAPPKALVLRDSEAVEVPTSEIVVDDLLPTSAAIFSLAAVTGVLSGDARRIADHLDDRPARALPVADQLPQRRAELTYSCLPQHGYQAAGSLRQGLIEPS